MTRKLAVWLIVSAAAVFVLVYGFDPPPTHEIHTPGATPLEGAVLLTNIHSSFKTVPASQSISDVGCQVWGQEHPNAPCPADVATLYFFKYTLAVQAPNTLYVVWLGCTGGYGFGLPYNLEYLPSGRNLVIHCIDAEPWIPRYSPTLMGVRGVGVAGVTQMLLTVPTDSIDRGTIHIVEDDRVEHIFRDQSIEFALGTATISRG